MPAQSQQGYYSPTREYLEAAEEQSQLIDNRIFTLRGNTANSSDITGNFYAYLKFALKRRNYKVYIGNVRLWIPHYRAYTHPDIMVTLEVPVFDSNGNDDVKNLLLIAEVTPKSTKKPERGSKFDYYRSLPELREYILIDQDKFHVEHFTKTSEGAWLLTKHESVDAVLVLSAIDVQIQLSEIYEGVNFKSKKD